MSLIDELNQVIDDLPFNRHQMKRSDIAHFCEHDGIYISFTRARTTWRARAPSAIKPWWLFLEPLRKNLRKDMLNKLMREQNDKIQNNDTRTTKIINEETEVTENA